MGLSNMMDLVSRSTLFCLATCIFEEEKEFKYLFSKEGENRFDKNNDFRNKIEASDF